MTTVLVADDQPLLRAGFRLLIDSTPDLVTVGEAATGREAVELGLALRPDLVLMDVRMPGLDGIQATRTLVPAGVKVLVLTAYDLDEHVHAALRAGAAGFLLKDAPPEALLTAIRQVAAGQASLDPGVAARLIAEFARRPDPGAPEIGDLATLTPRERQVLTLAGRGWDNRRIATYLDLRVATVKTHIRHLMAKLDAHDRAQLVVVAYESGLIAPGGR
ncbi:response regulator [Sinosporangium siamense]|uniref:DNA-binding response regulator n=1 Tax=Sinosporangium siamense TaxID=1367973 RepID=A0A919RN65_9ACTN|nr:response regulator transcription factor [Sinosporangium siamense]GII96793.1 DNA-binding response regulator [Sinosporangium siamense]